MRKRAQATRTRRDVSGEADLEAEWTKWRAKRDLALATKAETCPPVPRAAEFLEALYEPDDVLEPRRRAIRHATEPDRTAPPDRGPQLRRAALGETIDRMTVGLDPETARLVWITCIEASRAARAISRGGLIVDASSASPPPFGSAMMYLDGVLAWRKLRLSKTKAMKGAPSVWRLDASSKIDATRRRNRARLSMFEVPVPQSPARERADRVCCWIAEEIASKACGEPAISEIAVQPCSGAECCLSRAHNVRNAEAEAAEVKSTVAAQLPSLKRQLEAARTAQIEFDSADRQGLYGPVGQDAFRTQREALQREREAAESALRELGARVRHAEFLVELAHRDVPAVTVRGRRGARRALCDLCSESAKSVYDMRREKRGYRDPRGGPELLSQKMYRLRLEQKGDTVVRYPLGLEP